jgi:hypothetical protein
MLKDTLLKLKQEAGDNRELCIVGRAYKTMDKETQEAFVGVCRSAAFTTEIAKALRADGHDISRETFSRRRLCFTNQNPDCCMKDECPK